MGQTYGSQVFGPLYDVIGWVVAVGVFAFFALGAQGLTPQQRQRLPSWLSNRWLCWGLAALSGALAIGKYFGRL